MENTKLKVGNKVRIISNDIQRKYVGSIGVVNKIYSLFDDEKEVYRVYVNGKPLKGVALASDLELVK